MSLDLSVGASELAAVLGIDPFKTTEQLWRLKSGLEVFEGNANTRRGTYFEPALIRWFLDLSEGKDQLEKYRYVATRIAQPQPWSTPQLELHHPSRPWARATPDLFVYCKPVTKSDEVLILCDVKCPSSQSKKLEGGAWEKQWDESLQLAPLNYRVQVLWQLGVARAAGIPVQYGELAAGPFFGRLHRVLVEPNDVFFARALEKAADFRELVRTGTPPPPDFNKPTDFNQPGESYV